jgi:hypothetical protein
MLAVLIACVPLSWAGASSVEYDVKAAYLSKFGNFVQWPSDKAATGPMNICIVGSDPFGEAIDRVVQGRRIGTHELGIRRIAEPSADALSDCHILYTGALKPERVAEVLDATRGKHLLTVSDARSSSSAAPVITFVLRDNNVRFEIDEQAASENGLVISSQLLALAVSVKAMK